MATVTSFTATRFLELEAEVAALSGSGVGDGDKGDIIVSGGGTVWTIDNLTVTGSKIGTAAVTDTKLGDLAVTSAKINTGAVIDTKIGTGAVTEAKLGVGAVTSAKIATGNIVDTHISSAAQIGFIVVNPIAARPGTSGVVIWATSSNPINAINGDIRIRAS